MRWTFIPPFLFPPLKTAEDRILAAQTADSTTLRMLTPQKRPRTPPVRKKNKKVLLKVEFKRVSCGMPRLASWSVRETLLDLERKHEIQGLQQKCTLQGSVLFLSPGDHLSRGCGQLHLQEGPTFEQQCAVVLVILCQERPGHLVNAIIHGASGQDLQEPDIPLAPEDCPAELHVCLGGGV